MTLAIETAIQTALAAVCPRTFPDVAPDGTAPPYLVWRLDSGTPVRYVEGTIPDRRNALLQVAAWSATRAESNTVLQQVELSLLAAPALSTRAITEVHMAYDEDVDLGGAMQDFDVWGAR